MEVAKLSVSQALLKAKSHAKKGEIEEAQKLYHAVLHAFPMNKRAQQGLAYLKKSKPAIIIDSPPEETIYQLINLYNKGEFVAAVEQATSLTAQYPEAFFVWNILGAANKGLDRVSQASEAFKKVTKFNPNYADGFNNLGITLKLQGKLEEALEAYNRAISLEPEFAEAYNNMGNALQEQEKLAEAINAFKKALSIKPDYTEAYCNIGNVLKDLGELEEAIEACKKAISLKPDYAEAYYIVSIVRQKQGKLEEALEACNRSLAIQPDYAEAYNNMGVTLKEQGKLEEAIKAFNKSLSLEPEFAEAYNNMGVTLKEQGKLEEAIGACTKALSLKPNYAEAYNNMGVTLKEQGKLEEAIGACTKALSLKPNYAEAYNNMGITLKAQGRLKEAIKACTKALSLKPDYTEAYYSIGNALQEQGKLKEAIEAYKKALLLKPDLAETWNNIFFPLQAMKLRTTVEKFHLPALDQHANCSYAKVAESVLNYRLNRGNSSISQHLQKIISLLSSSDNTSIKNPKVPSRKLVHELKTPEKITTLVHFGRSGTGLMHSLIDGHPEVSTLPSIYLSEFFDPSAWKKIIAGGWDEIIDRFLVTYEVLFDASSTSKIASKSSKFIDSIGRKEGMVSVGEKRNEVLNLDKEQFCKELKRLMDCHEWLDAISFFKLINTAYDITLKDNNKKSLIFYHIHNPDTLAQLNFLRSVPNSNCIVMVREPLQSCESWVQKDFSTNNYEEIVNKIFQMLFEVDDAYFLKANSIGIRLEDLKENPKKIISKLCDWLGIKEEDSLYKMTVQGKKWWGDPGSPDYVKDGMKPFGKTSINRKLGSVFSEEDQFILRTLFYPFSVKFGYISENKEEFKEALQAVRPLLDQMFDFEREIVEKTGMDKGQFMKSGPFLYLRSGMIERWNTLIELQTYPNMLEPLAVDLSDTLRS